MLVRVGSQTPGGRFLSHPSSHSALPDVSISPPPNLHQRSSQGCAGICEVTPSGTNNSCFPCAENRARLCVWPFSPGICSRALWVCLHGSVQGLAREGAIIRLERRQRFPRERERVLGAGRIQRRAGIRDQLPELGLTAASLTSADEAAPMTQDCSCRPAKHPAAPRQAESVGE